MQWVEGCPGIEDSFSLYGFQSSTAIFTERKEGRYHQYNQTIASST